VRVVVTDDHPLFREGLASLLDRPPSMEVVGSAGDGTTAVMLALETQPDVVVMDLHLPDMDGIAATRAIVSQSPHIAVLVLTMFSDDDSLFAALRAGARGYLLKGSDQDDIRRAVEAVARGEAIFGRSIADRMMSFFAVRRGFDVELAFPELTAREREVLELVAEGLNNDSIGRRLGVSTKTIKNHLSNIFVKLQVADRSEAIVRARRAGLGE
jgi:DNA-binding NarL/FixJ family response regulator